MNTILLMSCWWYKCDEHYIVNELLMVFLLWRLLKMCCHFYCRWLWITLSRRRLLVQCGCGWERLAFQYHMVPCYSRPGGNPTILSYFMLYLFCFHSTRMITAMFDRSQYIHHDLERIPHFIHANKHTELLLNGQRLQQKNVPADICDITVQKSQ